MMNTVRAGEHQGLRLVKSGEKLCPGQTLPGVEARLARKLRSAAGCGQVLFASAPAQAMARAIAVARSYGLAKHGPDCTGVLVLTHRDADWWLANADGHFREMPQEPSELGKMLDGSVCAVVFSYWEPGRGPLSPAYVRELFFLCRSAGVLLLSDETALGLGRTGTLLAWEGYGKQPDLTVTSLGGGLGACLLRGGLEAAGRQELLPVRAYAEALKALEALLVPGALASVADAGRYVQAALSCLPGLARVSSLGLALSAALEPEAAARLRGRSLPAMGLTVRQGELLLVPDSGVGKGELARGLALLRRLLGQS